MKRINTLHIQLTDIIANVIIYLTIENFLITWKQVKILYGPATVNRECSVYATEISGRHRPHFFMSQDTYIRNLLKAMDLSWKNKDKNSKYGLCLLARSFFYKTKEEFI